MAFVKLGRNTQIALFIAGGVLAIHFYNQLLYKPLHKEARFLDQEKLRLKDEIDLLGVNRDELRRLQEMYQRQFEELPKLEESVDQLEAKLPSRKNMAELLEQLTQELGALEAEFVSVEPEMKKAEEGEPFDSIVIEMQFYADYAQVVGYLKKLEESSILLTVKKVEMVLDPSVSKKPLVTVQFLTLVSDRVWGEKKGEELKPIPPPAPAQVASPFHPESKPYDNRLPGSHKLTMVVWKGGTPVALIDGKLVKKGAILDSKKLTEIEADGVWFTEDGVKYYLALEQ